MVQSGLVFHAPLHEASGRANDLSGNGNHGTLSGGPIQGIAGKGGLTAYSFDGNDDVVENTSVRPSDFGISSTSEISISAWVKLKSAPSNTATAIDFSGDGNRNFISATTNGELSFGHYDGSQYYRKGDSVKLNKWVHIVGIRSGLEVQLYIDNVLRPNSSNGYGGTVGMSIGRDSENFRDHVEAEVADVRVYNRALSPSEAEYLYQIGSVDVATPPAEEDSAAVARYAFDDRSDTSTALDTFGANDGTINGATYSADSIRGLSTSYDGTNDRIELPDLGLSKSQSFTVSAWAKKTADVNGHIFGRYDGTADILEMKWRSSTSGRSLDVRVGEAGGNELQPSGGTFTEGSWYNFAMVYDSGGPSLTSYVNGTQLATATGTVDDFGDADGPWIGARSDGVQYFQGEIDDVRVYSRTLSDQEIHQLYNWGTRGIDRRYELIRK